MHRIDAMLPDERVVLYQKCVETLMVSWQARKTEIESRRPGKDRADQRHLRRLAAIAQWMHEQAGSDGAERRAVARKADLISMLRDHILKVERWPGNHDEAEDEAESFLRFVRERAGLLIEAGADLYSFVHLTFQEYLTARHIIILSEAKGDGFIWDKLEPLITNPRWREVIRLLVAERQSEESKRTLTGNILGAGKNFPSLSDKAAVAALAGGLLIDRIPAAMERAVDVMASLLAAVAICADDETSAASALLTQLATLLHREENAGPLWDQAVAQALERAGSDRWMRAGIVLAAFTLPLPAERVRPLMSTLEQDDLEAAALAEGLLWGASTVPPPGRMALSRLYHAVYYYSIKAPETNIIASIIAGSLPGQSQRLLSGVMIATAILDAAGSGGPFHDLTVNNTSIYIMWGRMDRKSIRDIEPRRDRDRDRDRDRRDRDRFRVGLLDRGVGDQDTLLNRLLGQHQDGVRLAERNLDRDRDLIWKLFCDPASDRFSDRVLNPRVLRARHHVWSALADERFIQNSLIEAVLIPLEISRAAIWREALRRHFLPSLPSRQTVFRPKILDSIAADLANGQLKDATIQSAACWLLVDAAVDLSSVPNFAQRSRLAELVAVSELIDHPILAIARTLRRFWLGDEKAIETLLAMIDPPPAALEELFIEIGLIVPHSRRPTPA